MWTFSRKVEAVWQKCYRQWCIVNFHLSKATVRSNFSLKKKKQFLAPSWTMSWKFSARSTNFANRIVKLALWAPGGLISGNEPKFSFSKILRHWADNFQPFDRMNQAKLPKQLFTFRERNFEEIVLFEKMSVFSCLLRTISKNLFVYLFLSSGKAFKAACYVWVGSKIFFNGESVFSHYFRTLNENLDAVWQAIQTISSKLLFTCPVQLFVTKSFFVMIHKSSFLDNYWKKIRIFGEKLLTSIMFPASLTKMSSMSPAERLSKFFPKRWTFPFV